MKTQMAPLPRAEKIDLEEIRRDWDAGEITLICVLGPTASGKTRYAVGLAERIGGEIISADSRQIYRRMDIGTGKDICEYGEIPYHLIDIRDAGEQYNVHDFQQDFFEAYNQILSRGKIPILCGGTGLYISAGNKYRGNGNLFLRINVACPKETVMRGMKLLRDGIRAFEKEN